MGDERHGVGLGLGGGEKKDGRKKIKKGRNGKSKIL